MESVGELLKGIWGVWSEIFGHIAEFVPKMVIFTLWFVCGLIILPCVFVAGTLFPKWSDWGEKM